MVRLNLELYKDDIQGFVSWLNSKDTYGDGVDVKHWVSIREFTYRDMFSVTLSDCSFVFALGFNGCTEDRYKGFVEFNPNKCMGNSQFSEILGYLFSITSYRQVVRFDLAIDIPVPKYLVRMHKDQRNYKYIKGKQSESEYLGMRNKPGYVKLYDKTAESNLDYDLTRLEITCELGKINIPTVYVMPLQERLEFGKISSTDKVLIGLLKEVDNPTIFLQGLKYEKRKKIEPYLFEDTVQLDKKAYHEIYRQVLQYQS